MKKTNLTRTLLAAVSIVALTTVMYGCVHDGDDDPAPTTTPPAMDDGDDDATPPPADDDEDDAPPPPPPPVDEEEEEEEVDTGPTPEEIVAMTKAAATKRMAIVAESRQTITGDAGLGGSARDNQDTTAGTLATPAGYADDPYGLAIKRDGTGTTVTITVPGAAATAPKFAQTMDLGGGITMHTRTQEADEDGNVDDEVVMVATDIRAPRPMPFAGVHELDANAAGVAAIGASAVALDFTDSALASTDTAQAAILAHVQSPAFTPGDANILSYLPARADDAGTTGIDETRAAAEVDGTFNGAPGSYKCADSTATNTCTVTFGATGKITNMSDNWIFIPDTGAMAQVADASYLNYGFWLSRTTDADGAITYNEVETFAGSSLDASDGTELNTVAGSATYAGNALGVYVHNVHTSGGGDIESATSGHFTADVALAVNFGQTVDDTATTPNEADLIADGLLNTVTGSITNFVLSGEEENDWAVNLMRGDRGTDVATFSGLAQGGGAVGSYSGTFHGATPTTPSTTDGTARVAPLHAVGEFNANFSNGTVAGAFGAEKQ